MPPVLRPAGIQQDSSEDAARTACAQGAGRCRVRGAARAGSEAGALAVEVSSACAGDSPPARARPAATAAVRCVSKENAAYTGKRSLPSFQFLPRAGGQAKTRYHCSNGRHGPRDSGPPISLHGKRVVSAHFTTVFLPVQTEVASERDSLRQTEKGA